MKKSLLALMCAAGVLGATSANAGFYGSVGLGNSMGVDFEGGAESNGGFSNLIAVGYKVPLLPIKVELENFHYDGGSVDTLAGSSTIVNGTMINAYAALPTPIVSPYIGIGVGQGDMTVDYVGTSGRTGAIQGMVGLELDIPLIPVNFAVEYRVTRIDWDGDNMDTSGVFLKTSVSF